MKKIIKIKILVSGTRTGCQLFDAYMKKGLLKGARYHSAIWRPNNKECFMSIYNRKKYVYLKGRVPCIQCF